MRWGDSASSVCGWVAWGGVLVVGVMDPLPFPRPTRVLVVGMQKHGARHKKKLFTK